MSTARMTRDQLREALNDLGIKTNTKLKKADLVKLYRENVLQQEVTAVSPNDSLIGGFSSDEEDVQPMDTSYITKDTNVSGLTNDEIFFKLKDLGETVGPILDSTRTIYERRLSKILSGDDQEISAFSADEDDQEVEKETETTDEYEIQPEQLKPNGINFDKPIEEDGHVKSFNTFHERVEENNGNVVRVRKAHSVRTFTSETVSGKSFVPPPPKKKNIALIGGVSFVVILALAFLIWWNFESAKQTFGSKSSGVPIKSQV